MYDLLHLGRLGRLPGLLQSGARGSRHDEHAGLDLEDMRVPELSLRRREGFIQLGCYHVFDAYELGVWAGPVVQDALPYVCRLVNNCPGHAGKITHPR